MEEKIKNQILNIYYNPELGLTSANDIYKKLDKNVFKQ